MEKQVINVMRKDEFGELFESPIQSLKTTASEAANLSPGKAKLSEVVGDAPTLANRKAPYYHVQQEKPHHRVFLELAAKGYTVKEIGEMTGFTPVCVNNILRQPHTQQFLVNEIRDIYSVDEEVVTVIKDNIVDIVKGLVNVAKSGVNESARIAAANSLLDRRYGKPNQPINRGTDVDLNKLSDEELAAMLPTQGTNTSVSV